MAVDPRQVLAGLLTVSMFAMVGNMIKRDHFDSIEVTGFFFVSSSPSCLVDVCTVVRVMLQQNFICQSFVS